MKTSRVLYALCLVVGMMGCAGKGDVVTVNLHALPTTPNITVTDTRPPLKVLIMPFEDHRPEKHRVGRRTHVGGGITQFDVPEGKLGDRMAQVLADYLGQLGWQTTMAPSNGDTPDVTLTGEIQDLVADAKSRFGSTKLMVRAKLAFRLVNADSSAARFGVNGGRTESVALFEPKQLERVLNEVLHDSFEKLVAEIKVEDRALHLR